MLSQEGFKTAAETILHRGPDSQHTDITSTRMSFYCRLAFKGSSKRASAWYPSKSNNVEVMLNGEIYNYIEIGKQIGLSLQEILEIGDTGVLAELIDHSGVDAISTLNGHFAIAIYYSARQEYILLRDRYGAKPLYYSIFGGIFTFASEVKPIIAAFPKLGEKDIFALNIYLATQNFFEDMTAFRHISIIKPGEVITYCKGELRKKKYFQWPTSSGASNYEDYYSDQLEELFLSAVGLQWQKSESVAGYLSSGLDSTLIAIASKKLGLEYTPYILDFVLEDYSELKDAKDTANKIGLNLQVVTMSEVKFWENLSGISRVVEEPRFGQCVNNYVIVESLSRFSRVAMSGFGGDELFTGYSWRYPMKRRAGQNPMPIQNKTEVQKHMLNNIHRQYAPEYESNSKVANTMHTDVLEFLNELISETISDTYSPNDEWWGLIAWRNFDFNYWMPSLLTVEDKIAMNFGVETRCPFLDNNLFAFANNFHPQDYFVEKSKITGKSPLRNLAEKWGFPEVAKRKKKGFSAPDEIWFRNSSNLLEKSKTSLTPDSCLSLEDRAHFISLHQQEFSNLRGLMWSFTYLDDFFQCY
jgi:asparagine synthase (glutamine-hydrolysing)